MGTTRYAENIKYLNMNIRKITKKPEYFQQPDDNNNNDNDV